MHTMITDHVFAWLDGTALRRITKLDLHHIENGLGGQAMLHMFQKVHKETEVFPRTIVVQDVTRRDTQTRVPRPVLCHLDSTAEYGFQLNYPCRGFVSRCARSAGMDDDGEPPEAVS